MHVPSQTQAQRVKPRPWYRRKLILALAGLFGLLLIGTAAGMMYINRQFAEINQISTPPPKISGGVFDVDATAQVDTGPAQQALAFADSGATGKFTIDDGKDAAVSPTATSTPTVMPATTATVAATIPASGTGGLTLVHVRDLQIVNPGSTEESTAAAVASVTAETIEPTPTATIASTSQPQSFSLKPVKQSSGDAMNILLMGVDARPGEAIDVGVRPDSLSVLHLDPATGSCRILAVPRDTRTELAGYGLTKVNHALAVGGIPYEMLVVEQLLGIEIDHYGLIDFAGIEDLVDAVGGVTVNNPEAFEHLGYTFAHGEITLDGPEALAYARFRYDDQGDFGRIGRQQQIIRAIISQASGMDVLQGANKLLSGVEGHFKTDLSPTDLIGLANDYRSSCTASTLEVAHLNGEIATYPDPLLKMNLSYVVITQAEIDEKLAWLITG